LTGLKTKRSLAAAWRKWRNPFKSRKTPNCPSPRRLREIILPPFQNFCRTTRALGKQAERRQLTNALRELWNELDVEKTLEQWSLANAECLPSLITRHSSLHLTVWEQMNAWLDNVALAFSDEALALRDWLPILEAGLANLTAGVIPPALDQVLIGAIDRAAIPI